MAAQLENGFIRIANEIWDEIIRRDFSKRQKDILLFIWRLSYGCNRKAALIPMLKDFEMCGVLATHITKEIKHLVECKVIEWERPENLYWFNKDYRYWQVSPVKGWDADRYRSLVHMNISDKTYQNSNLPKQELTESVSLDLPKSEVEGPKNPVIPRDEGLSKDSIKDTQEEEVKTAMDAYKFAFSKIMYTGFIQGYVNDLYKRGFTESFVREVFLEMGARGIGADERYMRKLAEDWISKGIYTRAEAERRKNASKNVIPLIPKSNNDDLPSAADLIAAEEERLQRSREERDRMFER